MNRQELVNKLELASLGLDDRATAPILQCFMFDGERVIANNDIVGVIIPCGNEEAFAVNGKTLLGLLTNSQSDEVEFEDGGHDIIVKTGKSEFKLPCLPPSDFIIMKDEKIKPTIEIPLPQTTIDGIGHALVTSSHDATQAALMGVTLTLNKSVFFYSCDGDAITRFNTEVKCGIGNDIMLPNGFCEAVIKIAKAVGLGKAPKLIANESWAKATLGGNHVVYGRVIQNSNPLDHEDVIKKTLKGIQHYVPRPDGLNEALSRAMVVAKAESAKTVLTVTKGKLNLLTETHSGVVNDSVALPKHPDVTAHVSAELMQRSLAICDEIAITDRCVAYRSGETLFQIISNVTK